MKKRNILLFVGAIFLIVVFAIVLIFQTQETLLPSDLNPTTQPSVAQSNATQTLQPLRQKVGAGNPTNLPERKTLNADDTAKAFYYFMLSSSGNPLAAGGYKNNQYLSSDFKDVIHKLYDNGNNPVFCPQNKRTAIVVGQDQQVYYNNGYLTQVVISEAAPGAKKLYRVLLQNIGNQWYIFDVNCIY
jgi:hypothetical protein